jgi:hypothetical protein
MSGGLMRNHKSCRRSKKWDAKSPICKVCGYRVFYEDKNQTLDKFAKTKNSEQEKGK